MAPALASWVPVPEGCDWTIHNIPFGIFSTLTNTTPRPGTAIGEHVLDLSVLASAGVFPAEYADTLKQPTLNAFMGKGRPVWKDARARIQALLAAPESCADADATLRGDAALKAKALLPAADVAMHLPAAIGDYTDYYSSRDHATNVGVMFRGPANALQPNWLHLPVGYHGRSSSIVVSGTPFKRPCGQLQADKADPAKGSVYGPSAEMDFELEMGLFVGPGTQLGEPVDAATAADHMFGFVLMNDWSARDIQRWEYVPLGPFGAKNFATTISPWVVTLEALEPFRCATSSGAQTEPPPLPYLRDPAYGSWDVQLEVAIAPTGDAAAAAALPPTGAVVSRSNFKYMYWSPAQQLAHHTVTGCNMRPGDLLGSGTISGPDPSSYGSMLELAWKGTKPVPLGSTGATRVFLADGDAVTIRGWCEKDGVRVGFGECAGLMLPAAPYAGPKAAAAAAEQPSA